MNVQDDITIISKELQFLLLQGMCSRFFISVRNTRRNQYFHLSLLCSCSDQVTFFSTGNTFSRPDTFLPYLLSLSIFSPNAKKSSLNNLFDPEPLERSGPFKTVYYWNELDFDYPSEEDREAAIIYNDFIPKHNLPLGKS